MSKKIAGLSKELLEKCVRCGSCRQVCPVFNVTKEEPSVARGKIFLANLINKGVIELDKEAADIFNLCTTCLRCREICPLSVDYEKIIISARSLAVEKFGLPIEKKAAVKVFSSNRALKALGIFSPVSKLFTTPSQSPQNRLLPVEIPRLGKVLIPQMSFKPFNENQTYRAESEKGKVLFFTGCMFNNFYTETARNVIKVLNRLGYTVHVPKEQVCCGAPAYFAGDLKTYERLAEKNIQVFQQDGYDFVITACATCGHVIKEYMEKPVKELIEILYEEIDIIKSWELSRRVKVTWHYPCHIVRGQKIPKNYPIEVLTSLKNLEFIEMEEADNCCGMGGSFKLSHPEISKEIQLKKAKNIGETGAEIVVTECPGCVMNIAEGIERKNLKVKTLHIADLLSQTIPRSEPVP